PARRPPRGEVLGAQPPDGADGPGADGGPGGAGGPPGDEPDEAGWGQGDPGALADEEDGPAAGAGPADDTEDLANGPPPRRPGRGPIVLVATPIGSLAALSDRAREGLATAAVIACEDTRGTGRLLQMAGIGRRPMVVVNGHTESGRAESLV